MSDKVIYRRPSTDAFLLTNTDNARSFLPSIYEGLVVDVILDHKHPEYSRKDGYNVGTIKVRIFEVNQTLTDEQLHWADPLDITVQEYPLIGELVMIHKVRGNYFYKNKVAIANRLQENGMLKLNDFLNNRGSNTLSNAVLSSVEYINNTHKFGGYFRPDSRIRRLKHFEGDLLFQGRMGNSIRFGSSKMDPSSNGMAPNVIIRAGQGKDVEKEAVSIDTVFGLVLEDINKDASSIWLTADQAVPFEPATINAGSFVRSITNPPQVFDKAQVIINSDRVVLNSKASHIMMFSNEGIHLNSFKETTIDTDNNIALTANLDINLNANGNITNTADKNYFINSGEDITLMALKKTSIIANQIFIGSADQTTEPMVGGKTLSAWLSDLITTLRNAIINTQTGPGKFNPQVLNQLKQLQDKLGNNTNSVFNSKNNFVSLVNQKPQVVLNEFESGTQSEVIENKWNLSDSYYKVV